jgi:hypothetical protein
LSITTFGVSVVVTLLFHTLSATAFAALITVNVPFQVTHLNTNLYKFSPLLVLCHVNVFVLGVKLVFHTLNVKSPTAKSHVFIHDIISVTFIYIVIVVPLFAKRGVPFQSNETTGAVLSCVLLVPLLHALVFPNLSLLLTKYIYVCQSFRFSKTVFRSDNQSVT